MLIMKEHGADLALTINIRFTQITKYYVFRPHFRQFSSGKCHNIYNPLLDCNVGHIRLTT